jgi:hypothetical protein
MIPKRKRNSRSKGLSSSARHQADCPRSGRTVREPTTDHPRDSGGLSEKDLQTSSTAPTITDRPWRHLGPSATNTLLADCPRNPGGSSAKPPATEEGWKNGSKGRRSRTSDEHEEHRASRLHTDRLQPIGRLSTRHEQSSPNSKPRSQPLLPIQGSPKRLELLRKDLGEV